MSEVEMDDENFREIPVSAFNVTLRLKLGNMLNPELPFFEKDSCARDFRGLAELMGFTNNDIMNFQRQKDPTVDILRASGNKHTVLDFLQILKAMQRYDVIDDLMPFIVLDCNLHQKNRLEKFQPILATENVDNLCSPYNPDILTIYDSDELATFDAYVCYANSDIEFVKWLSKNLESPNYNIRLCLRDRDLQLGTLEYDTFVRLVQERCQRILIVLSPEFLETPEYDYQARYAASLASEHRNRRLIPIVYKPCEIPAILKYLSKVDFSRVDIQDWIWAKLVASIKTSSSKLFVPTTGLQDETQPDFNSIPLASEASSSGSFSMSVLPDVPSDPISDDATSSREPLYPTLKNLENRPLIVESKSKSPVIFKKIRNMILSSLSSSSASSGFHSQSVA